MRRDARNYPPCEATKRFDAWCESMEGLQSAEEGRYDIKYPIKGR